MNGDEAAADGGILAAVILGAVLLAFVLGALVLARSARRSSREEGHDGDV